MHKEFNYTVGGITYRGIAERRDLPWGKGIAVKTFDAQGKLRDSIGFGTHPEFDGFEEMQSRSPDELLSLAVEILNSGELEPSLDKARPYGLKVSTRLNGRLEELDPKANRTTRKYVAATSEQALAAMEKMQHSWIAQVLRV